MTPCTAFQRRGSRNKCKRQTTLFPPPPTHTLLLLLSGNRKNTENGRNPAPFAVFIHWRWTTFIPTSGVNASSAISSPLANSRNKIRKMSQNMRKRGRKNKKKRFLCKSGTNDRVQYRLDNFIINAFLWRAAYLFCIRHLALKQHSSPRETQRFCKWLPTQDVHSQDYLNESIKNKTSDALLFIDLWQNLWGRSKVVVIDGVGLMRTAPETHLMLSS